MAKPSPSRLKVYKEQSPQTARPTAAVGSLPEVLRAFRRATGWSLQYVADPKPSQKANLDHTCLIDLTWSAPDNPGVGAPLGHLRLDPVGSAATPETLATPAVSTIEPKAVRELASALGGMLGELLQAQHALWQREAELAAGVPLVPHSEEDMHLAARLQAVLKGGAEAVRCHAAGLYLLDEATTSLKLRSSWGLPPERLTHPARPLQGALADLEALLGHAVVLDDSDQLPHWNPPEDFPAAVCVPISTATTILGTLWLFSNEKRDFNSRETNIIEVVAGRLAAELEREMLLRVGIDGSQLARQIAAAQRMQRSQLPAIGPLLAGWEMAGWTAQPESLGGSFFDWFSLPDGLLAVTLADVPGQAIEAALTAGALRAALRSHGQYHRQADRLLNQVNLTLWTGSAGDQRASVFCGLIEPSTGRLEYAVAGQVVALLLDRAGWQSLSDRAPPLGIGPQANYRSQECRLEPGQTLVVFDAGSCPESVREASPLNEAGLAESLVSHLERPAQELAAMARDLLRLPASPTRRRGDRTVMAIKRTNS